MGAAIVFFQVRTGRPVKGRECCRQLHQPARANPTHHGHQARVDARSPGPSDLEGFQGWIDRPVGRINFSLVFRRQQNGFDDFHVAGRFTQGFLDNRFVLDPDGFSHEAERAVDKLELGQQPRIGLVGRPFSNAGAGVHLADQIDILVQKNALPGDKHIIKNRDCVHLVKAGAQRVILDRTQPGERLATQNLQPRRSNRDDKNHGVGGLCRGQGWRKGPGQNLIGERRGRGYHFRAANHQPLGGLVDNPETLIGVVLLGPVLGAVHLWINQGMGEKQVMLAAVFIIVQDAFPALRTLLGKIVGLGRPGGDHGIEKIRTTAHHATGRVRPDLAHGPPPHQVVPRARDQKRQPDRIAARR